MRKTSLLIGGLILAVTSTGALAQSGEWQVTVNPPMRASDGKPYCRMWSSKISPAIVVTAPQEKPYITVYSQELGSVNDSLVEGTLSFSSGRDHDLLFRVDDYDPSLLQAYAVLYGDKLDSILSEFIIGGKATFHIGSAEMSFRLDGAGPRALAFMACQKKL